MGEIIEENVIGVSIKVKFMGEIERRNSFNDNDTTSEKDIPSSSFRALIKILVFIQ